MESDMELITKKRTVMWYADLENFVNHHYGLDWRFLDHGGEYNNDSYTYPYEFNKDVDLNEEWEDHDGQFAAWRAGETQLVDLGYLFYDMAKRGLIPVDDYLIEIWW
jgi:hypothetical protein